MDARLLRRMTEHVSYSFRVSRAIAEQPYEGIGAHTIVSPNGVINGARGYAARTRSRVVAGITHAIIRTPWPCDEHREFDEIWHAAVSDIEISGLSVGRGAFGGWDDADIELGRAAWCLARHLCPARVIETGVARGLSTRILLEALERNAGRGHLWSIDLPPLLERALAQEVGAAVPTG